MAVYPPRSKVEKKQTWNAESVFSSAEAWEAELEAILAAPGISASFKGRLGEGACCSASSALRPATSLLSARQRVYMYAAFAQAVDTTDQQAAGMQGKAAGMYGQVAAAAGFLCPGTDRVRPGPAARVDAAGTETGGLRTQLR